ncbi:MAG: dehydrogenase, partial [Pseudomonadota bacterium]
MKARALWTTEPGVFDIQEQALGDAPNGSVVVSALCSGVSRGTESLVFQGLVPNELHDVMRCPGQDGTFDFPVKYGYALVGEVEAGPKDLLGQVVFALHPHQDRVVLSAADVRPLPADLPPRRAVLAANMETALNLAWDSGVGPGDRVLVVGAGVVGLLTAALISRIPAVDLIVADQNLARRDLVEAVGARFAGPDQLPEGVDCAFNLSGSAAGLQVAIDAAGQEATVIEGSWHGAAQSPLALGGTFHPRRITIKSSQVGSLPPHRVPRWTYARRIETALKLLVDRPELDALTGPSIPLGQAPDRLPTLL